MIEIDVMIDGGDWKGADELQSLCEQSLTAVQPLCADKVMAESEVSILFSNDAHVRELNLNWRGLDRPTNVLSFASNEGNGPVTPLLGDIVLGYETIEKEASQQAKIFNHHLQHLIIHGFLHLIGYDHIDDGEAQVMEGIEIQALENLGIPNPYETAAI